MIDEISFENPKTKDFLGALSTLGLSDAKKTTKTLIVDSLDNANLILSSRNVKKTKVTNSYGLNIYDLIYHEKLVLTKTAVEEITHLLDPNREKGVEVEAVAAEPVVEAKAEAKPKAKKEAKPKAEKVEAATEETPAAAETENKEEAADNE